MNVSICLFIIPSEVIFSTPGNHSNDGRNTQELLLFHLKIVLNTPKKNLLKSSHPKNTVLIKFSYPKKSWNQKFQTPPKKFDYLYHLKSQIPTPPPYPHTINAHDAKKVKDDSHEEWQTIESTKKSLFNTGLHSEGKIILTCNTSVIMTSSSSSLARENKTGYTLYVAN